MTRSTFWEYIREPGIVTNRFLGRQRVTIQLSLRTDSTCS
jgi:hypothetical protein